MAAVEHNKNYIPWVSVGNLCYPACKAHAPCWHLWPVRFYNIFPHYLINGTILKKVIEHKMCVLILYETFLMPGRTERDMIKNVYRSSSKVPVIFVRF
jgi:hypothetical protein